MVPPLDIPPSSSTMTVSLIDTTCDLVCVARDSIQPVLSGQLYLNLGTYAFLLEHAEKGTRLLYDGGGRKDWWNLSKVNVAGIQTGLPGLKVEKNINEILREGGVDDASINTIVWSHAHWDHIGDASLFPPSTNVVVGPGFTKRFMPGYPTDPEADMLDSDFAGREIREIPFDHDCLIAGFRAFDFFGDGALYLLDTPGHEVGHISALARTTPDTFVFLGGDICDAPQAWRPNRHMPLPDEIPLSVPLDSRFPRPCPCKLFLGCHPEKDESVARTTPFCRLSDAESSLYIEPGVAQQSAEALKALDADPSVLVCVAHDDSLLPTLRKFPEGNINDWKREGWKEATAWGFVNELPLHGKPGRALKVDGLYRDGERVRSADEVLKGC